MKTENINYLDLPSLRERIKNGEINFSPSYQRNGGVWSEEKQLLLIDSILRGYIIPPVYFLKNASGVWDVIDGLQRLHTIMNYCGKNCSDDVKRLNFTNYNIRDMGKLNGKTCKELLGFKGADYIGYEEETPYIDNLKSFKIPYILIYDTSERELKDVFCRLNSGEQLSNGEWLNGLLPTLPLWHVTKRFAQNITSDGSIAPIIYAKQKDSNKPYSEFDDERKMDVWFWANLSLTLYKRMIGSKATFVNGKSGLVCDEFDSLQESYNLMDQNGRDKEDALAQTVYDEMTTALPYFVDICRYISDEMKHAKALHTIFLYAVYLKDKRGSREHLRNPNGLPAKKIRIFFNDHIDPEDLNYYYDISEHIEKYKSCGSRNDSSSRQKRFAALKRAINL